MPHSSGGGFSGGSFGGSETFGGSGLFGGSDSYISSRRNRGTYIPTRYVYYIDRRPEYFYGYSSDIARYKTEKEWLKGFMVLLVTFGVMVLLTLGRHNPRQLNPSVDPCVVSDGANVISDTEEKEITELLEKFKEDTGITVQLSTIGSKTWYADYESLEDYAYDAYKHTFSNETGWLVVYSTDFGQVKEEWRFIGMQGNDTDKVLTKTKTRDFNYDFTRYLERRAQYTVGESFVNAFGTLSEDIMVPGWDTFNAPAILIIMAIGLIILAYMYFSYEPPRFEDKNGRLCEVPYKQLNKSYSCEKIEGDPKEDTCDYCNGIYIHGLHESCPHCGAPLRKIQKIIS